MTSEFACDVGNAVGVLVRQHGASDVDAGSVLLTLAVAMLSMGHVEEAQVRELFEGAMKLGPLVMTAAQLAKGGEA